MDYFQWPPCSLQTEPVLLHVRQVSFPTMPVARPPLQAWQSCTGLEHLRQRIM